MSIQKRGQAYVVRWRRDGRQHARSFVRKADAQAFELEQRRAGQMGAFAAAAPSRQTLDTLLDEWWASRSILWAASTREHREQALKRWIRPYVGGVQLRDLGRRRVEEWRAVIVQDGAKPRTANHALGVLSAALTAAVDANRIPANPCYGVRPVPEGKPQRRALTPDEVERICAAMPQLRDRVAVTVMAYAGLRPGEMLALRWDAVGEHLILVDRSWSYNEQRDTKTGRARTVELVGPLREDLDALRPGRAEPGALVVPSETGGYVDLHNWRRRVWTTACAGAGVKAAP